LNKPVRAKISALGTYVPPRLLTNADLEQMVDTSNEWIMSRVGIRERHIAEKGVASSDLAVEASRKALAQRGLQPTDIEAIIVGTVTPDMFFPSTACLVQDKLGAKGAWGFDLSAACSAFLYSVQVGAQFIASGAHKRVLAIGAALTVTSEFRIYKPSVLPISGSAARSGCGIIPITFRWSFKIPAMCRMEPFGLSM
jgi:3-oxoacyl-[acyl-carrier-protein] synthase-3